MGFFSKIFGDDNEKRIKGLQPLVDAVDALESEYEKLSQEDFPKKTEEFRKRLKGGESLDDIRVEAFALVREASKRTLNQRPFNTQVMTGLMLHEGTIVEMRTGEGKTLAVTMPLYLNALTGKNVNLVTTNDYLARVGVTWMGQIYKYLGMATAVINGESTSYIYDESHVSKEEDEERDESGYHKVLYDSLRPCTRREAYEADITYGTNSEFGFDYLRDNIATTPERMVQREPHFAIIDEVDSILIDEARTPLIIAGPVASSESLYPKFATIAASMKEGEEVEGEEGTGDYIVDEKTKQIQITQAGIDKAENALGMDNIYTEGGIKYVHQLETAIKAKALYKKEKEYVVKDGEVVIVDAFTGRMQPGRRWSEGLHQAIEAKEGVKIQQESRTYASITYQNYFKLYNKLSGTTGTAKTSAEEFQKVYGLEVVAIPPNKPIVRVDHNDLIYKSEEGKFKAIARKVKELNEKGQPVLIGTVSVEKSELLSAFLKGEGVRHEVLNAKRHEQEGEVIARAGAKGTVTIATNMAGRGIDIMLGGENASPEAHEEVKSLGGLFVMGTERHDARRIDDQLRGRSGRQGDPGESQFFVSMDDDLMRVFGGDRAKAIVSGTLSDDVAVDSKIITRSLENAQARIEGHHFDARRYTLEYDNVLNTQRKSIYERRHKVLVGNDEEVEEYLATVIAGDVEAQKAADDKRRELDETEDGLFIKAARALILQVIDMHWVEHLDSMDYLKNSVRLRAYGQRDPLIEYKKEGLNLYRAMEESIIDHILKLLPQVGGIKREPGADRSQLSEVHEGAKSVGNVDQKQQAEQVSQNHVGRNDPCPCGSGKKYKKCGLTGAPEHKEG